MIPKGPALPGGDLCTLPLGPGNQPTRPWMFAWPLCLRPLLARPDNVVNKQFPESASRPDPHPVPSTSPKLISLS